MGYGGFPDITGFYDQLYGTAGVDFGGLTLLYYGGASGIKFPGNPPYFVTDFIQIYPKFVGPKTTISGIVITEGSAVVSGVTNAQLVGMEPGQLVVNLASIPKDTLIQSIGANSITLSNPAITDDSSLSVYQAPFMPIIVIKTYVMLALASLKKSRYFASWEVVMSLFIAHYCTLYMRTESGVPNITASQVAASGLTKGVIVSRAAGDVSASSKLVMTDYAEFGAWNETQYGELFITIAAATATGPIWVP